MLAVMITHFSLITAIYSMNRIVVFLGGSIGYDFPKLSPGSESLFHTFPIFDSPPFFGF